LRRVIFRLEFHRDVPISAVFSMLINDLCSCIRFSKIHFYADDLLIYLSGDKKDLDEMISALYQDFAATC
jgi:hypothetical protein